MTHTKGLRVLFRQRWLVVAGILIQAALVALVIFGNSPISRILSFFFNLISIFIVLHLISTKMKPAYRLTWAVLVLLFPAPGCFVYLTLHLLPNRARIIKRFMKIEKESSSSYFLSKAPEVPYEIFDKYSPSVFYLREYAKFPLFDDSESRFFSTGEEAFPSILSDLEKAEHYIFLEYFIIQDGKMFDPMLDIMERKVKEGVDVRVMYDDIGSLFYLPAFYSSKLEARGIKCCVFNPFVPVISSIQNNRNHRKILSIDGKVAYTGGINIADEYINAIKKFGYWKDNAIRIEGSAAWSMTVMFLQLWNLSLNRASDYNLYYPAGQPFFNKIKPSGYILPYADSPLDTESVGEHVYLHIINQAKNYLYIETPYYIVDDNLNSALTLAAKSGVDVRLITPHIWDKRLVHIVTRSYYPELIAAGVKVYEFTPGFIHSKVFVSDDCVATVGTVNLDFRSLYLHFENGIWLYKSNTIADIKKDFLNTLSRCKKITLSDCKMNFLYKIFCNILRLFSPLL